jgi:hypothetical protein
MHRMKLKIAGAFSLMCAIFAPSSGAQDSNFRPVNSASSPKQMENTKTPVQIFDLWLERGGNHESLGNERFILRFDGRVIYERGVAFTRKDKTYGEVTDGRCERFSWVLSSAQLESLRHALSAAHLETLNASYVKPVDDGSQAGLLAHTSNGYLVSTFSNEFPTQYVALVEALKPLIAYAQESGGTKISAKGKPKMPKKLKATRCDVSTWFFLSPPNDSLPK